MITPPTTRDGRNLDPRIADDRGEGSLIDVETPNAAWPIPPQVTPHAATTPSETYYDLPVVKPAPWKWYVPMYFYVGGLAGAASTLAAGAELVRDARLARKLHWIASLGEVAGAGLLIGDLGKPARFVYMMRTFRPTSPMNMGTWILSATSVSGGLALLSSEFGRRARGGLGLPTTIAAVTGAMLSTYTGVLIGNTAVPVWNATRRRLPLYFAASSATALASLLELTGSQRRSYSLVAKTAELVTGFVVERAAAAERVARPLREGRSGLLWRSSRVLTIASLAATVLRRPRAAGVLGTIGSVLARFAIVDAGKASAADPRATFERGT